MVQHDWRAHRLRVGYDVQRLERGGAEEMLRDDGAPEPVRGGVEHAVDVVEERAPHVARLDGASLEETHRRSVFRIVIEVDVVAHAEVPALDEHEVLEAERDVLDVRALDDVIEEREIDRALGEERRDVGHLADAHVHREPGIGAEERRDRGEHARARDGGERCDAERARELELGSGVAVDGEVVEQLRLERALYLAVTKEARACFREGDAGGAAHEQALLQLGLELLDALGERGLRDVQACGRAGEAARGGDGMERVELMGREGHSRSLSAHAKVRLVLCGWIGHIFLMRSTFSSLAAVALALVSALGTGCAAESNGPGPDEAQAAEAAQSAAGRVGSHGMVLAGDPGSAILSHIPMFAAPHDVQMIVHGALTSESGRPLPATFSDRSYTFLPERTSLDALRLGVTRELKGTIYLGNFEQGGRPVAAGVKLAVDKVVHQHILIASTPAAADLGYLVFGSRAHAFAAHFIGAAPSFDEVLAVTLGPDAPSDVDLASGVLVHATGKADAPASRLGAHPTTAATVTDGAHAFTMRPIATLSCLTGPDFVDVCN